MAHKKESARTPGKENSSAINSTANCAPKFCPREQRLIDAFLRLGTFTRKQADRIACASNSPHLIFRLRQKLGEDAIETDTFEVRDRDGRACYPGRYSLSAIGRARLAQMGVAP